ncbi:MAG TPA: hypothetical protein VHS56_10995 [Candidatus Cybelea sp.]|nr:hypothetical protein [Candidatus Cybelea sp.]
MTASRLIAAAAVAIVIAVVAAAFVSIGPPSRARAEALDRKRIRDLGDVAAGLHDDYTDAGKLLPAIYDPPQRDPATGKPYAYRRLTSERYQLCGTFELPSPASGSDRTSPSFWHHPAGRHCFNLDVGARVESTP